MHRPVWLWWSRSGADPANVHRCWRSLLHRFDLEHTFRLLKQTPACATLEQPTAGPGWSSPPTPSCASPALAGREFRNRPTKVPHQRVRRNPPPPTRPTARLEEPAGHHEVGRALVLCNPR
ncbi:hypothetical protein [Streptomyces sp. NPDC004050]